MKTSLGVHTWIEHLWYERSPLAACLLPLSWLFQGLVSARRLAYRSGLCNVYRAPVPVIVVGNITVGGTGKTPLVIWLAEFLRRRGYRPGIVARGYGGRAKKWPQQVRGDSDPYGVGDEAVLIARGAGCPVAVAPDRPAAIQALLAHSDCNVIISDDGLQHYAMARDIEIAVLDGTRRCGNGLCLPAGPLREPAARLASVDIVVTNGIAGRGEFAMKYNAEAACSLTDPLTLQPLETFQPKAVHAVAGIAHGERFIVMLRTRNLQLTPHLFPDHHRFTPQDLDFGDARPVIMTEKDAIKCARFARANWWYVPIKAELPEVFGKRFETLLQGIKHG